MKVAIICPMEEEIGYYKEHLGLTTSEVVGPTEIWTASYEGHDLIVARCGIGKVNATIATTLVAQRQPDLIINTGSAGAVSPDRQIGDIIIGEATMYHDADARAFGYELGQVPTMPARYKAPENLIQGFLDAYHETELTATPGLILTGDQFIADVDKVISLYQTFRGAQCAEMEGAAVAQVANQFGIDCIVIRAISDTAQQDANVIFDEFVVTAGQNAAKVTLSYLKHLN
ncbi:5'-methylthioadenosine/adenosylhomocysteine nucleosidase [Aerococcus urinaeequi]